MWGIKLGITNEQNKQGEETRKRTKGTELKYKEASFVTEIWIVMKMETITRQESEKENWLGKHSLVESGCSMCIPQTFFVARGWQVEYCFWSNMLSVGIDVWNFLSICSIGCCICRRKSDDVSLRGWAVEGGWCSNREKSSVACYPVHQIIHQTCSKRFFYRSLALIMCSLRSVDSVIAVLSISNWYCELISTLSPMTR